MRYQQLKLQLLYGTLGLALQGCPQQILPPEAFARADGLEATVDVAGDMIKSDVQLYDTIESGSTIGDGLSRRGADGVQEEVAAAVDIFRIQDTSEVTAVQPDIQEVQSDSVKGELPDEKIKPYVKDEHCVVLFHFEAGDEFTDSCNGLKLNNYNTSEAGSLKEFGKARMFDGKAYLELPDAALLKVKSALTLEAIVKPQITGKSYEGKYGTVVTKEDFYEGYFLKVEEGKVTGGAALSDGKIHMVSSAYVLPVDTFTHLAFTYDGAKMKLYIEQKIVAEELAQGTIVYKTNKSVFMGLNAYENGFEGAIDEVRISDVAREF